MKIIFLLFLLSLAFVACEDESTNPTTPNSTGSKFSGYWKVDFQGDMSGDIDFWIENNAEFNNPLIVWTIINYETTHLYLHIIGNVSSNGNLIGIIKQDSTNSTLGSFNGTITEVNGSGTYSWTYASRTRSGEWTLLKQ